MPILKLAYSSMPKVTKNSEGSLSSTRLASRPIRMVTTQSMFANSDECRDLEYSFFLVKQVSSSCVRARTATTSGMRYQTSSKATWPR